MRCLSCERHTLYRIALQFTKEAVIAQRHSRLFEELMMEYDAFVGWEPPELSKQGMKGGVATIIIDKQLPNCQRKTVMAIAKEIAKMINSEDLQEGFIEITEISDVITLAEPKKAKVCNGGERQR